MWGSCRSYSLTFTYSSLIFMLCIIMKSNIMNSSMLFLWHIFVWLLLPIEIVKFQSTSPHPSDVILIFYKYFLSFTLRVTDCFNKNGVPWIDSINQIIRVVKKCYDLPCMSLEEWFLHDTDQVSLTSSGHWYHFRSRHRNKIVKSMCHMMLHPPNNYWMTLTTRIWSFQWLNARRCTHQT